MQRRLAGFCVFAAVFCISSRADTLTYTLLGTFDSSAILVPGLMGPDQFFQLSFSFPSQPIPGASSAGEDFDASPASITYLVGSVPTKLDSADVDFENPLARAGFDIAVSATYGQNTIVFQLQGPALYSGPESAPILVDAFPSITGGAYVWDNQQYGGALVNPFLLVADSPTPAPEPATFAAFALGLGIIAGVWFRRGRETGGCWCIFKRFPARKFEARHHFSGAGN